MNIVLIFVLTVWFTVTVVTSPGIRTGAYDMSYDEMFPSELVSHPIVMLVRLQPMTSNGGSEFSV